MTKEIKLLIRKDLVTKSEYLREKVLSLNIGFRVQNWWTKEVKIL